MTATQNTTGYQLANKFKHDSNFCNNNYGNLVGVFLQLQIASHCFTQAKKSKTDLKENSCRMDKADIEAKIAAFKSLD